MSAGWTVAECRNCGATLDVGARGDDAPLCAICAYEDESDEERGLIPDGGQELVWVRGAGSGKSRDHYHTDPDCYALGRATEAVQKPLAVLAGDIQECRRCAGTVASGHGRPSTTLSDRLEAMDPGDLDDLLDGGNGETLIGDGGTDHYGGAGNGQCLAIKDSDGERCTNGVYGSNEFCGTHKRASDVTTAIEVSDVEWVRCEECGWQKAEWDGPDPPCCSWCGVRISRRHYEVREGGQR